MPPRCQVIVESPQREKHNHRLRTTCASGAYTLGISPPGRPKDERRNAVKNHQNTKCFDGRAPLSCLSERVMLYCVCAGYSVESEIYVIV